MTVLHDNALLTFRQGGPEEVKPPFGGQNLHYFSCKINNKINF